MDSREKKYRRQLFIFRVAITQPISSYLHIVVNPVGRRSLIGSEIRYDGCWWHTSLFWTAGDKPLYWFPLPILILQIPLDKITSGFLNLLLLAQKAVNQKRVIN